MGEARRRRLCREDTSKDVWDRPLWSPFMEAVHQAGGVLDLEIIHPHDAFGLVNAALSGSERAGALMRAIAEQGIHVEVAAKAKDPTLCLLCPRTILDAIPCTFCLIAPSVPEPTMVVASVICPQCAKVSDLMAKATEAYRQQLWPSLRQIQINPHPGHA